MMGADPPCAPGSAGAVRPPAGVGPGDRCLLVGQFGPLPLIVEGFGIVRRHGHVLLVR